MNLIGQLNKVIKSLKSSKMPSEIKNTAHFLNTKGQWKRRRMLWWQEWKKVSKFSKIIYSNNNKNTWTLSLPPKYHLQLTLIEKFLIILLHKTQKNNFWMSTCKFKKLRWVKSYHLWHWKSRTLAQRSSKTKLPEIWRDSRLEA